MMGSGEGGVRLHTLILNNGKGMGYGIEGGRLVDLVSYDIKSSDTLYLLILGFVMSGLIALGAAGVGAWLGNKFSSQEPIQVQIVDAAPASQSEQDSNE